jgi:hypothetical protein
MIRPTSVRFTVALFLGAALLAFAGTAIAQTSTSATGKAALATTVVDPCTKQYVSVAGSTALSVTEDVSASGALSFKLLGVTGATGAAFSATSTKYTFSESAEMQVITLGPRPIDVSIVTKLYAAGATTADRWVLRILLSVSADQFGNITAATAKPVGTVCIGG